jgi:hypothetical protein
MIAAKLKQVLLLGKAAGQAETQKEGLDKINLILNHKIAV